MNWNAKSKTLQVSLESMSIRDLEAAEISADQGFQQWVECVDHVRRDGRYVYLIGNGASASMASHFAADLMKNGGVQTRTFFDLSLMSAISNDISYEEVFSFPLSQMAKPGDLLIAISSSGQSPNILKAVEVARACGAKTVTLSAMKSTNPLRQMGSLNFFVDAPTYGLAETAHAAVLHHWMDLIESTCSGAADSP